MEHGVNWSLTLRRWVGAGLAAIALAGPAQAEDRPFLRLDTALVGDDERTLEVSTLLSRTRDEHSLRVRLEYNLSPVLAAEMEMGWANERGGPARERNLELGVRQVLVDHHREGWGLAVRWAMEWEKSAAQSWRLDGPVVVAAFVLPLMDKQGRLHANLGASRRNSVGNTRAVWGVGADVPVARSFALFAEAAGRVTDDRLVHGGLRWWIKPEKLAFDVSLSRTRTLATGDMARGVHVGLNIFDLDL